MTSMDPTTADTIDADAAMGNEEETGGLHSISGESDGAGTAETQTTDTAATDGAIAGETEGAGAAEDGDKQYPGD